MARAHVPIPPLLWALVAFATGIALGDALLAQRPDLAPPAWLLGALLLAALAPLGVFLAWADAPQALRRGALILGLVVAGGLRAAALQGSPHPVWPSEVRLWEGPVDAVDGPDAQGACRAQLRLPPAPEMAPLPIAVHLPEGCSGVIPGGALRFKGRVRVHEPRHNPGERDRGPRMRREGLSGQATAQGAVSLPQGGTPGLGARLTPLRLQTWAILGEAVSPDAASILSALLTGDKSRLGDDTRRAFSESGLAHALAISGLHVAGLGLGVAGLLRVAFARGLGLRAGWAAGLSNLGGLGFSLAYALFAGLPLSAIRAWLMMAIALGVRLSGRRSGALGALALAGFALLILAPGDLFDLGFQLSFVSVASLLVLLPPLERALAALPLWPRSDGLPAHPMKAAVTGYIKGSLLASVAASLGGAPLMALHFQGISLASPIANLLGLLLLGPIALPLGLTGLIAHGAGAPWIGDQILWVAGLATEGALQVAEMFSDGGPIPYWRVAVGPLGAAAWGLLTLAVLAGLRRSPLAPLALGGALLCAAPALRELAPQPPVLTLTQLAVGQGDGLYLRFPSGEVMVVDGGGMAGWGKEKGSGWDPGREVMLPALLAEGIGRIDHMVLSHPDPDHLGGLVALAQALPVGTLWLGEPTAGGFRERLSPGLVATNPGDDLGALLDAVVARGGRVHLALAGDSLRIGGVVVRVLHPSAGFDAAGPDPRKAANNGSLTLAVEAWGERILLPGDLEAYAEAHLLTRDEPLESAVLKLPHHGSDTSSTPAFLDRVRPQLALVGVGRENRFGFPREVVLERLAARGVRLCRTDIGACRVALSAEGVGVWQWRTPGGWGPVRGPEGGPWDPPGGIDAEPIDGRVAGWMGRSEGSAEGGPWPQ